jgi:hypothetical protein
MRGALLAQGVCGGTFWPLSLPPCVPGVEGSLSPCAVLIDAGARAQGVESQAPPRAARVYTLAAVAAAALECVYSNDAKVLHRYKNKSAGHARGRLRGALIDWRIECRARLKVKTVAGFFRRTGIFPTLDDVSCQRR